MRNELQADQVLNSSLGSAIEVFERILNKSVDNGLIFVNQASIQNQLIQYAIDRHNTKRILVIDWDVGFNAFTQKIFYDNPRVLRVSIHQFRGGESPPESDFDFVGDENARGYNVNIALNNVNVNPFFSPT